MKRVCFLFLFLFTATLTVRGQSFNSKFDSLKNELGKAQNDSVRIRILNGLSFELMYRDYAQSKKYADEILELALKQNWRWAESLAYSRLGYLGTVKGDHLTALEYDNKNLKVSLLGNDSSKLSTVYNDVGNDYLALGKYEEAYFYVTKSYELASKIKHLQNTAIALHNLAVLYSKLDRMDLALVHFENSAALSLRADDLDGPSYNKHELGNAYLRDGNYEKAEEYLFAALRASRERDIDILIPRVLQSIGDLYLSKNQALKSISYYDSAVTEFKKIENTFGQAEAQLGKSKVFILQKKYNEAKSLAQTSLKKAEELKAQILMNECYQVLSQCDAMQGDYKSAFTFSQKAQQTKDSLTSINIMSHVFENEFQMRAQKKDEEIANLTRLSELSSFEIKRQQFIRNIFAVVFALTIVLLYSVYKSGRRKVEINALLMKHQEESAKRTEELEELNKVKDKFFSIISHDLRSPINSLAGLLDLMEKDQIKPEELPAITKEMRVQFNHTKNLINNLLDWTLLQMNKVAIKKEKISLKNVIDENIKLLASMNTKKTSFANNVDDSFVAIADNNMINLIFRNLILNGIKFTDNGGVITLDATKNEKEITVTVSDNGVGISPEVKEVLFEKTTGYSTRGTANEKGTGLGLILCKEFIERNGGRIWLESEPGKGSTFYVTIPVA